jgi:signal transduction histidine kinase
MPTGDPNEVVFGREDATEEHSFEVHMRQPTRPFSGLRSRLRWRAALLILIASVGAALLAEPLEAITHTKILGLKGNHVLHVLVTIPAAIWVARKVGTAPVWCGVVVGLFSGIANQIYNHALPGTLTTYEVTVIVPASVAAGGLGGVMARSTLAGQETLYRVSQAIGEASDLQDIVDAIGEQLSDPRVSHVALWQNASGEQEGATGISLLAVWMPSVTRVWGSGVWRPGLRLDASQVSALGSLRQRSPLVLRVGRLPASERALWEHQGIRYVVLLPLITSGGAQDGLLMIASRRSYSFSMVRLRTYLTIGAQVALMLENFRLIEQAQQAGVSSERQRLARDIHDTLAQAFTTIVMKLEAAEARMPSDLDAVQRYLDQARNIARESLVEARRYMWALRPEVLERSSLPEALGRLAERWSQESGVVASVTVSGTPYSLPPETKVTLLRVAQEALTNCRKHARARQVLITVSYMHNLVTLNVQDDGVGFDPARLRPHSREQDDSGFGLTGMRERVEQLRGALMVESTPGEGCTLMAAVPVAAGGRTDEDAEAMESGSPPRGKTR